MFLKYATEQEKAIYRNMVNSQYGAWPRLDELTEACDRATEIEDAFCKRDLELSRKIAEKNEEENKMKNITWTTKSIELNHSSPYEPATITLELTGITRDHFTVSDYHVLRRGIENALGNAPRTPRLTTYHPDRIIPEIKDVIFNGPATIVLWKDGTKTVVKAQEGEIVDYEKGMAMAIAKRILGNKGSYYDTFTKYLPKEEEPAEEAE